MVAMLRLESGRTPHDRALNELVGVLTTGSGLFAALRAGRDVRIHTTGTKRFHHPVAGCLSLQYETLERISGSTFFRQFRAKEDVIFADHEALFGELHAYLSEIHPDPWAAVCEVAALVFRRFDDRRELGHQRYIIVQAVPALRERETIMVSRYERSRTTCAKPCRASLPSTCSGLPQLLPPPKITSCAKWYWGFPLEPS
ncbi:hypothetical protein AHiyo4_45710 [Arthrobacter sp. Hiyo4]|nr:hypothetical protein AHiyo4_45710 [Arthrobacter sp. Hiyo4]